MILSMCFDGRGIDVMTTIEDENGRHSMGFYFERIFDSLVTEAVSVLCHTFMSPLQMLCTKNIQEYEDVLISLSLLITMKLLHLVTR